MDTGTKIPDKVDVLVVGAGPGGLSASRFLQDTGASILLVDARLRIGTPIRCAELSRERLWNVLEIEPEDSWIRMKLPAHGGATVLNRANMEYDLAVRLAEKGVRVSSATTVTAVSDFDGSGRMATIIRGSEKFRVKAKVIIAADGVSSRVAQYCGLKTYLPLYSLGSCLAYRITGARLKTPEKYKLEFFPGNWPYYFWVIPSGEGEANVGIVLPGNQGPKVKRTLHGMISDTDLISGGTISEKIVGLYPITRPITRPYASGLIVIGTAARLINATNGEGIWQAAVSGKAAAKTIAEAQDMSKYNLAPYNDKIDRLKKSLINKYNSEASDGTK